MFRKLLLTLLLVALAGCTTIETAIESVDLDAYYQHAENVASIDEWRILGKMSVRSGSRGEIGRFLWTREGDSNHLEFYGNFGSRRIRIIQDPEMAVLEDTQGRKIVGSSIEAVLEQRTGQTLPINSLMYWIVGMIDPNASSVNVWDVEGRLISIEQSGWTVKFSKYRGVASYQLPTRLDLIADDAAAPTDESGRKIEEVRVVVSDWVVE